MLLAFVLVFLAFVYGSLMFAYLLGWRAIPRWTLPEGFQPKELVTVVIAARNEAEHIIACLQSIQNGNYPSKLFEIIVVDDYSEDHTARLVHRFIDQGGANGAPMLNCRLLELSTILPEAYRLTANKKKAIEWAVAQAQGDIIVTTDADCLVPADWLRLLVSRFNADTNLKILAAPVVFHRERNVLQRFQSLDFLGLMGITGAGIQLGWHVMGNGANLAYRKEAFVSVGGFSGNEQVASGDDMFLLQKMVAKWPGSVGFLKSPAAVVCTEAKATWREFWHQRLRWGTKNAALPAWRIRLVLLAVWLFCWSIWLGLILVLVGYMPWQVLVFQLFVKVVGDWFFLWELCGFFNRKELMHSFFASFLLHTVYIVVIGTASMRMTQYHWKGRVVVAMK